MMTELLDLFLEADGVSVDTRTLHRNELFFALRGPNFNGNEYAQQALERGAKAVVVDDLDLRDVPKCHYVPDVLGALQQLARAYRDTWTCPVIGLTGSNGKTTTKELLVACLAKDYAVGYTRGNLNNHIGVPLTLLRTASTAEIVVVEMGANHQREIAALCEIAHPTHGLITNIGRAHLEGFGGIEGVRIGKGELYDYLESHGGRVFVNVDDEETSRMAGRLSRRLNFSTATAPEKVDDRHIFSAQLTSPFPTVSCALNAEKQTVSTNSHLPGAHNYQNICAAAAVSSYFKIDLQDIAAVIAEYAPQNARSEVRVFGQAKLLYDAYNANPDSMRAALRWLFSRPEHQKIAVLGEMAELGAFAKTAHAKLVEEALSQSGVEVIAFGSAYQGLQADRVRHVKDLQKLRELLQQRAGQANTVILLKGSRSNRLEQVLAKA